MNNVKSFALSIAILGAVYAGPLLAQQTAVAPSRWERTIARFEAADQESPPAPGQILFVGSSSIVRWETLEEDFASLDVLNRGFGGSLIQDVLQFTDRVILAYRPRHVLLYAGDNDVTRRTAQEIYDDYLAIVAQVHEALPETRISFISIKPSPSRWGYADVSIEANEMVRAFTETDHRLSYIDVWGPMLGTDGQPREELFVDDMLHMNEHGYVLWRSIVAGYVER